MAAMMPPLLEWLAKRGIAALYDEETAASLPAGAAAGKTREEVAAG